MIVNSQVGMGRKWGCRTTKDGSFDISSSVHENSVGLSSTTNPKPKGQPSISLPAQANLTQQKAEPLRCLALRTRGGRLKSSFVPWELSLPT